VIVTQRDGRHNYVHIPNSDSDLFECKEDILVVGTQRDVRYGYVHISNSDSDIFEWWIKQRTRSCIRYTARWSS
jgi:hypothetical protein